MNTVLKDDPQLTARGVERSRLHWCIILDSRLRTPLESKLVASAKELDVDLYLTREGFTSADPARIKSFLSQGVRLA